MRKYRLCGIQVETGEDREANVAKTLGFIERAARRKPDVIVLPEMFEMAAKPEEAHAFSHQLDSPFTERFSDLARAHSVNIVGGTFFERSGDHIYNTAVVYGRDGSVLGAYRKMHLFDAFHYGESKGIRRGDGPLIVQLDGLKAGIAVCYDIRFPEIFRDYAVRGADVVILPAAYFQPNHDHWTLNIRSRALDNTLFIMTCNQTGDRFVGRSMTVGPWGIPVASMGMEEGFYIAEIDIDLIRKVRRKLPFLENRRYDVVPREE